MSDTAVEVVETFGRVEEVLQGLKLPHGYLGALAAVAWGRIRATTDVDCVVLLRPEQWHALDTRLVAAGFKPGKHLGPAEPSDSMPDMAVYWSDHANGVRVDIFIAKLEFEREVVARVRTARVLGSERPVVSPESSIVYKLLAHREKDILDVRSILEARKIAGDALDWAFIDHWCAEWGITDRLAPWRAQFGPA